MTDFSRQAPRDEKVYKTLMKRNEKYSKIISSGGFGIYVKVIENESFIKWCSENLKNPWEISPLYIIFCDEDRHKLLIAVSTAEDAALCKLFWG